MAWIIRLGIEITIEFRINFRVTALQSKIFFYFDFFICFIKCSSSQKVALIKMYF